MTDSTPTTPCPSTPDETERRTHGLAAFAHTAGNPGGADEAAEPPWGSTPDESGRRTHGFATHIPPTSESSPDADADPAPDGPETGSEGPHGDLEDSRGSKDAARYRRQLRAAEAEREVLAARVEALQRAEVETRVEALGVRPAALWAAGVQLSDLLDADGTVDGERVAGVVAGVRDTFGIKPAPKPKPRMFRSGATPASVPMSGPSWQSAFAPKDK